MEKKHIIQLQGRDFVTYEGLLDAAHKQGLTHIRTSLVQIPRADNDQTAIVEAVVTIGTGDEARTFGGIGDASPRNVSRNIAMHLIRMAETRAKARALRDAINVGMAALEELEIAELPTESGAAPATRAQIDRVGREMKRTGLDPESGRAWLQKQYGKQSRSELTESEIGAFLAYLASLPSAEGN